MRAAGAVPKMTRRSPAALSKVTATLRNSFAEIPGTGWAIDPATSKVTVWTDSSVTGDRMAAVQRTTRQMGTAVRMVHFPGRLHTLALGGDPIFGESSRCSLGFNVRRGQQDFFLTAGHCGNAVRNWAADPQGAQTLGTTVQSSFPGNDFALVQVEQGAVKARSTSTTGRRGTSRRPGRPSSGSASSAAAAPPASTPGRCSPPTPR